MKAEETSRDGALEPKTQVESAWVTVEGVSVHYRVGGPASGRPLVFLHGIGGSSGDWHENLDCFAEHGFRVYAPDLPGHGLSKAPAPDWHPRNGGQTVLAMLNAWGARKAVLVGNSAGGLLAIQAALVDQKRVEALVLAAPAGLGRAIHPLLRILTVPVLGGLLWRPSPLTGRMAMRSLFADRSLIEPAMITAWVQRHQDPAQRRVFLKLLRMGAGLRGLRRELLLLDSLAEIRCPVQLVWGREDQVIPVAQAQAFILCLPETQLLLLSPCGHWPQMEQAERFNRTVEGFLAGVPAQP